MTRDISDVLADWPFDPEQPRVRIVRAPDGSEKVQMRVDLGVLQMNRDGRPDGERPEGCESWLEYYQQQAAATPSGGFSLSGDDCRRLMREGIQYYHRYLSFWLLERYELCARDTARNLRLFAFVRQHAPAREDRLLFDQYRPYVTMMHARAVATPLVQLRQYDAALSAVDAGLTGIRAFLKEHRQTQRAKQCAELWQLERLREQIVSERDANHDPRAARLAELQAQLREAIADERFEDAAQLRDALRDFSASADDSSPPDES